MSMLANGSPEKSDRAAKKKITDKVNAAGQNFVTTTPTSIVYEAPSKSKDMDENETT